MTNTKERASQINAIRAHARGISLETYLQGTCPTCCQGRYDVRYVYTARGKCVQGCVDAFHAGCVPLGEAARWWSREAARQIRKTCWEAIK